MKRHRALEPFSRDHNTGLILARGLQLRRDGAEADVRRAWELELRDHFDEEERLLGPLADPGLLQRLIDEHRAIASAIQALPDDMERLGDALHDHIRWEEREFFPAIERAATPEQLASLEAQTHALEQRRWEHDEQRRRLVQRRPR